MLMQAFGAENFSARIRPLPGHVLSHCHVPSRYCPCFRIVTAFCHSRWLDAREGKDYARWTRRSRRAQLFSLFSNSIVCSPLNSHLLPFLAPNDSCKVPRIIALAKNRNWPRTKLTSVVDFSNDKRKYKEHAGGQSGRGCKIPGFRILLITQGFSRYDTRGHLRRVDRRPAAYCDHRQSNPKSVERARMEWHVGNGVHLRVKSYQPPMVRG